MASVHWVTNRGKLLLLQGVGDDAGASVTISTIPVPGQTAHYRRVMRKLVPAILLVISAVGMASTAEAGKYKGTLTADTSGWSFGDTVTFSVSTDSPDPIVQVRCYQDGVQVYYFNHADTFTFGPNLFSSWSGGAADCEAKLLSLRDRGADQVMDSMTFAVEA